MLFAACNSAPPPVQSAAPLPSTPLESAAPTPSPTLDLKLLFPVTDNPVKLSCAEVTGDTLNIYVDLSVCGWPCPILKDITVATDVNFNNRLKIANEYPSSSGFVYTYKLSEPVEAVYISPPTLSLITKIEPVLALDLTQKTLMLDGKEWLSVSSITYEKRAENYQVYIEADLKSIETPTLCKFVMDGKELEQADYLRIFKIDSYRGSGSGRLSFFLPATNEEEVHSMLKKTSLVIEKIIRRVLAEDAKYSIVKDK